MSEESLLLDFKSLDEAAPQSTIDDVAMEIRSMSAVENARPRRGRPVGSGIDDEIALRKLAAFLVEHPNAKLSAAIRQACGLPRTDDTVLHRINRKWRTRRQELLAEAKTVEIEDAYCKTRAIMAEIAGFVPKHIPYMHLSIPRLPADIALTLGGIGAFANSPEFAAILAFQKSPAFEAMRNMQKAMSAFDNTWMGAIHKAASIQRRRVAT